MATDGYVRDTRLHDLPRSVDTIQDELLCTIIPISTFCSYLWFVPKFTFSLSLGVALHRYHGISLIDGVAGG